MRKSNKPSKRQLRNTLLDSLVDPRSPGPMAAILEEATPLFLMQRAQEMIREALTLSQQKVQSQVPMVQEQNKNLEVSRKLKLRDAITLLAIARMD